MSKRQSHLPRPSASGAQTPPILLAKTQKVINAIESRLDERLLTYWNSPNGSICNNHVAGLYEAKLRKHFGLVNAIGIDPKTGERLGAADPRDQGSAAGY